MTRTHNIDSSNVGAESFYNLSLLSKVLTFAYPHKVIELTGVTVSVEKDESGNIVRVIDQTQKRNEIVRKLRENRSINEAIADTQKALDAALAYSVQFQKPAQIKYYREHIAVLEGMLRGEQLPRAVSDLAAWDDMNCVIEARAAKAAQS